MNIFNEKSNRNTLNKNKKELNSLIGSLKRLEPLLNIQIINSEIFTVLKTLSSCQISGLPLNKISETSIVLLDPLLSLKDININNVLFVSNETKELWLEVHSFILKEENKDSFEYFKELKNRIQFVKEHIRNKSKSNSFVETNIDLIIQKSLTIPERILMLDPINIKNARDKYVPTDLSIFIKTKPKKPWFTTKQKLFKINNCKKYSAEKGLTCNLNLKNSSHLFDITHCQLTGLPLVRGEKDQAADLCYTFDRINRFEGYIDSNILVMAREANDIKGKLEKDNYSEDIEKIREILIETKQQMLKKYSNYKTYDRVKPMKIKNIIKQYLSKDPFEKRFDFTL